MPDPDQRGRTRLVEDRRIVLGLVVLWGVAHWQLASAFLWGVTLCDRHDRRRHWWRFRDDSRCWLETDPWVFWPTLYPWIALGPVFLCGTLVVLWIQRNDRV